MKTHILFYLLDSLLIGYKDGNSVAINMGIKDNFLWISIGRVASLEFMKEKEITRNFKNLK
ncbi:phosphoglycerate kinase [Mycoplasma capricolum subsp. capricolum]|uniref:phosphoglycerate kinase n=1 Tax=Mycoplasma capricolum TaxID=2095 RepID=UPI0020BDE68B|nr:phosphoglycerate kinase [Mycoplasma capricolum]MCK8462195.1 phosphoglycerate kinase [Mycoplasma capricolum subsp. capricolum]